MSLVYARDLKSPAKPAAVKKSFEELTDVERVGLLKDIAIKMGLVRSPPSPAENNGNRQPNPVDDKQGGSKPKK